MIREAKKEDLQDITVWIKQRLFSGCRVETVAFISFVYYFLAVCCETCYNKQRKWY